MPNHALSLAIRVSVITALLVTGCNLKIDGLDDLLGEGEVTVEARRRNRGSERGTLPGDEDPCRYEADPDACYVGDDSEYVGDESEYYGDESEYNCEGDKCYGEGGDAELCGYAVEPEECFYYEGCAWGDDGYGERCLYLGDPGMKKPYPGKEDVCAWAGDYESCLSDPSCAWCDRGDGQSGCHTVVEPDDDWAFCEISSDALECESQGCLWVEQGSYCSSYDDPGRQPGGGFCEKTLEPEVCVKLGCSWEEEAGYCHDSGMSKPSEGPDGMDVLK